MISPREETVMIMATEMDMMMLQKMTIIMMSMNI